MYIFDTDHISFIQRNGKEGKNILTKSKKVATTEFFVTIITYEEQLRGRLAFLAKKRTLEEQLLAYQGLFQLAINYQTIPLLPFDQRATLEYQKLRQQYPRLGSMDLKIAAIALVNQAVLLTRNQSDFGKILDLKSEDWSHD
ncbi:MAG: type II toxin-antitoxin system VapC family toxin [Snowella sp.]|nr:type II toxin-antitoxin system VapC family toxin [Snowella sp.]